MTQTDVLGARALNRALLARQFLLRRTDLPVLDTVRHLVGLQAQAPDPPYFQLWSRLAGFRPQDLAGPLEDRSVVRIVLMRGTIHLVTADDCRMLRPLTQPILDRDLHTNTTMSPAIRGMDLTALAEAARELLDAQPRPGGELGTLLAQRWTDRDPRMLTQAVRNLLPLVQIPPRGVWGKSGQPTYATAQTWLGTSLEDAPSAERMVLRYLAAFGPATVTDVQTWSGLTGLREIVDGLRPRLRTFADERGRELFDVPDAPRPDPDTPAPVRFIGPFDNILLSHADRTRVISEDHRKRLFHTPNGVFPGTVLVDGFVRGSWKITRDKHATTVTVEPYAPLSKKHAASVRAEGRRLLRFAAPDAARHEVAL